MMNVHKIIEGHQVQTCYSHMPDRQTRLRRVKGATGPLRAVREVSGYAICNMPSDRAQPPPSTVVKTLAVLNTAPVLRTHRRDENRQAQTV